MQTIADTCGLASIISSATEKNVGCWDVILGGEATAKWVTHPGHPKWDGRDRLPLVARSPSQSTSDLGRDLVRLAHLN